MRQGVCKCSGFSNGGPLLPNLEVVDKVHIPATLAPGRYVLQVESGLGLGLVSHMHAQMHTGGSYTHAYDTYSVAHEHIVGRGSQTHSLDYFAAYS